MNNKIKNQNFEEQLKKFQGLVYSIIYGITLNANESWDITQDVFIKAYNEPDFLDKDFKHKAWLATVARNDALKYKRSIKRKLNYLIRFCGLNSDDHTEQIEEQIMKEQNSILLKNLLMELSEDEREILALRFSAELSYKEIAEILNVKIGTVMSRLSRLKTKLGNDFLEESDE
jgi:RNA polymerase sigma-70 factor (ECF subfamily)